MFGIDVCKMFVKQIHSQSSFLWLSHKIMCLRTYFLVTILNGVKLLYRVDIMDKVARICFHLSAIHQIWLLDLVNHFGTHHMTVKPVLRRFPPKPPEEELDDPPPRRQLQHDNPVDKSIRALN